VLADIQVALDEVLTNIISYAYNDKAEHEIRIRFQYPMTCWSGDRGPWVRSIAHKSARICARRCTNARRRVGLHFVRN